MADGILREIVSNDGVILGWFFDRKFESLKHMDVFRMHAPPVSSLVEGHFDASATDISHYEFRITSVMFTDKHWYSSTCKTYLQPIDKLPDDFWDWPDCIKARSDHFN